MKQSENRWAKKRKKMVREQLIGAGIKDLRVLEVMEKIPRHKFMPKDFQSDAYKNKATWIGEGQTISQPFVVAYMTELLALKGSEKVLEIGTGSGYQTAILAGLAKEVFSIERHKSLAELSKRKLEELGYENIHVYQGDGSVGLPKESPFQAILITAAAPEIPEPLWDQLAEGGRMVAPVGSEIQQQIILYERHGSQFKKTAKIPVVFVPLLGEYAWDEEEWTTL
ncbi:MAG: protein-L-isoaspartate(D-aspartate) O-methyltransferase [Chloroflexi bacterium]|jgi:protein-L-isoaspartate(D-aspartate) O-methyltransferase|nr:protein-L-isoaspartate(D-aspartate) O-methyltransferase [Chloroflexota bacterium]MBT3670571.1 protein-L-isoaspartate(D-aspartate) O-methyltransferase [Chloroflexota bacterium]MBT4002397.1 protein-L-isoaspartate(D-aspartate) O-methyltransferase [Chloroflexota bacterium]MBT4304206.1 protein-L-isoaspartate(D-aspartate) O-methyltransferase [Chloroflexota bacterium]MBT4533435.1 protein-L-isoaspartate(D-aspartate) O-methyltransferase [Chloroflexota bacterium]